MEPTSYFYDTWLGKTDPLEYVTDKQKSIRAYMKYMVIRLQKMFKYKNLPETIPQEVLEYYLLVNGVCVIAKDKGTSQLFALTGNLGGMQDAYYRPTKYIVSNPGLKLTEEYEIGKDCVLMRNDSMWEGLYPLLARYATMLAENLITMRSADIMLRVMAMLTAPDDKTKIAAEAYLSKLEEGKFGVISENRFLDGVKMQSPPSNNGSYLTQFIELHQYLKGSFFNEIGLNANFNMKREAIGEGESSLNEDSLLPLCQSMLQCRQEDVEKVNNMYGTNIEVEFDSAWANKLMEIELRLKALEAESSQLDEVSESVDEISPVEEAAIEEDGNSTKEEEDGNPTKEEEKETPTEVDGEETPTEEDEEEEPAEEERSDENEDENSAVEDEDTDD